MRERGRYKCNLCHRVFYRGRDLKSHARNTHGASLKDLLDIEKGERAHREQLGRLGKIGRKVDLGDDPRKEALTNRTEVTKFSTPPSDITYGTVRGHRR